MGHLSKLQDEYGDKGLHVLAMTSEDQKMTMRYMVHNDNNFTYKVGIGSPGDYGVTGIPHAYLIDPDGKVVWQGSASSLSKKDLGKILKKRKAPDEYHIEKVSKKMLAFGDSLRDDKQVLRAKVQYGKLVKAYPGTPAAEKAAEEIKAIGDDEDLKAEMAAQLAIAKITGGIEAPNPNAKKLKSKKVVSGAKKLRKLAAKWAESAPRSAQLAKDWASIMEIRWM